MATGYSRFVSALVVLMVFVSQESIAQEKNRFGFCEWSKGWPMCLITDSPELLGNRIPVILIHGWEMKGIPGVPDLTVWPRLVDYLQRFSWFREKYRLYYVSYYSNLQSLDAMGQIFRDLVDSMSLADPEFRRKQLVLIGFSMGGLLARACMQEPLFGGGAGQLGGDKVLKLITLGSPHHGSPFANGPARDVKAGWWLELLHQFVDGSLFGFDIRWYMHNRSDLHWDNYDGLFDYEGSSENNFWLKRLNADTSFNYKISVYGGEVTPSDGIYDCFNLNLKYCLAAIMNIVLGIKQSDGLVPFTSALFEPCTGCGSVHPFLDYNHSEMVRGKTADDPLFQRVAEDLFGALLVGRWRISLTGHTAYGQGPSIRWIELDLSQPLSAWNPSWRNLPFWPNPSPLLARWSDSAGCRAGIETDNPYIFGDVSEGFEISIGVEHHYCNDDTDFYLHGTADKKLNVITGTCGGGLNCRFTMVKR